MKKTYLAPTATSLTLQAETMLATSFSKGSSENPVTGDQALSDERSFESPIWGSDEE